MKKQFIITSVVILFYSCSPIKSSPEEERHKVELTLHEVQTNLDDSRHDLNCFHAEMQIVDSKLKHLEGAIDNLKHNYFDKLLSRCEQLSSQLANMEKKVKQAEKLQDIAKNDMKSLSYQSNETREALIQYKSKIGELEKEIKKQTDKFQEIAKLRTMIKSLAGEMGRNEGNAICYKVKSGDSLEKIAKNYKTTVEMLKKVNNLDHDLIVVGQELKIPKT